MPVVKVSGNHLNKSRPANPISPLPVDPDGPDLEVDPDGGDVVAREGVVREPNQEGALPHARVADDEQLEQVVVVPGGGAQRHLAGGSSGRVSPEVHF
jgi:hypothetical protein